MTDLFAVAYKEVLDLRRDPLLGVLLGFLTVSIVISVLIGSADFHGQLDAYRQYVSQLSSSNSTAVPAAPQLFPLQLLRGGIEYVEILGALLAVVLGYGTVAKEKHRGTLDLILTRPLRRFSLAGGKLVALSFVWFVIVAAISLVSVLAVATVGGAALSGHDLVRVLILAVVAWVYLIFWSALSVGITALSRQLSAGLIVGLVVWLVVVLIMPQIGDTMDPDNQVPGGLFASLQIKKADELTVMAHFSGFDTIRNGIEVSSIEKHFERLSFAFTGIKQQYNQQSLRYIWADMFPYAITLMAASVASVIFALLATTRRTLRRKLP
ncbi:ABC transporter permease subunit [Microbacterium sp. 13-71-7]|uniref:ABC transporter permease n=1 Tax=Microbacterium sp. 13-71-7 TaxID=1970399 RepID=UPI000BC47787|nr:ABC transporter permease subunit [Microbacterium sp. 13-71-7]OZB82575.1 MAG: polyphenol oxidoreductase [Microbacterium sp. 13-71-7]